MSLRCVLLLALSAGVFAMASACKRQTTPPPRFNEDLADAGEPALLPITPVHFAKGVRGRLQRVDRATGGEGEEGTDEGAADADPQAEAVRDAIDGYNQLIANRDYDNIPELFVSEQRDTVLDIYSAMKNAQLTLNDALDQLTEALAVVDSNQLPRLDTIREKAKSVVGRQFNLLKVSLEGDSAKVLISESLFPTSSGGDDAQQMTLRHVGNSWLIDAKDTLSDGDISPLLDRLSAASTAIEGASSEFERTRIDAKQYLERMETIVETLTGGAPSGANAAEAGASEDAEDTTASDDATNAGDENAPEEDSGPPPAPQNSGPAGLEP